jgi:DNA-binding XRE family transcriptional regulator
MQRRRISKTGPVSDAQHQRDETLRAKYATRPTLKDLQASGDVRESIKQGEYLALMQFAASLKRFRESQNLSLADIATRTGIDKSAISRIENGVADNPTIATLERLARSVGKRIVIELEDDAPERRK